ncbi:interferon alpha-inducible protein 27-like protein 2A [Haliotis cracherodii]|uniref:interferon alpha-inducible protein 27-like protein 2A n=1 Tax=Haliotis cracherodii TaxID=6455 RepID=UPI0039EA6F9A
MSRTYVVCYLLLISSLGVSDKEDEKSFWDDPAVEGGAVVGEVAAPFAPGARLAGLGFTEAGIKAGSFAAGAMSAVAQSAGAARVAVTTKAAMAVVGGTIGYFNSGCSEPSCENEKN